MSTRLQVRSEEGWMTQEPVPNELLREARLEKCWTLTVAAEKANVSIEAYSRWEYGTQVPRLSSLKLLCDAFGKTAGELGFGFLIKKQPLTEEQRDHSEQQAAPSVDFMTLTQEEADLLAPLFPLLKGDDIMTDEAKRETIRTILAVVIGMTTRTPLALLSSHADPEPGERLERARTSPSALNTATLDRFEHIIAECWELSNMNELETADGILSSFLPKILALPPREGKVAYVASHGLRLRSVLIHHSLKISEKVWMCEQSVEYARHAQDANTLTTALIELADAYEFAGQMEKCLKTLQEALHYSTQASPLVQSRIYSNYAIILGHIQRKREADLYIQLAHEVFPDDPRHDPAHALADSSVFTLSYHSGLVSLDTGRLSHAFDAFEGYQQHPSGTAIPERLRLEIANGQSKAAIRIHDLELYAHFLEDCIVGATRLGSKKRLDETHSIFEQEMPRAWLANTRIKALAEKYHLERV
jgi:transcriptional regulator with XRE-family HTH domain/tetratricopeptide (TPR) repeat protein